MTILPYLETFSAVVENESFTAAAHALGISKPVVSKQVSQLERHLGETSEPAATYLSALDELGLVNRDNDGRCEIASHFLCRWLQERADHTSDTPK